KKRSLFSFGKKKAADEFSKPVKSTPKSASQNSNITGSSDKNMSPPRRTTTASPIQTDQSHYAPSSPGRSIPFASSPRLSSPAGSQIFERDVQESASGLIPNSPAIPSHIQTENYIPPVLDASSEAITDDHLDPDNVEIITHTSHTPAAVAVTSAISSHHTSPYNEPASSWADELAAFSAERTGRFDRAGFAGGDGASNYGSFDTTDVRRLSFISFADVVQAEQHQQQQHVAGSRDSMHLAGLTSLTPAAMGIHNNNNAAGMNRNRSPSPIRSRSPPAAGARGTGVGAGTVPSPPTSKSGSVKGLDMSAGSSSPGGGEIAIETMSQALRRTGSGEL
ncbi:hypothetical protein N656DRAFT_681368, partial [Canariomyces notabilis]